MPLKKRAKAIEAFQNDPPTTIFLLSVRSGAFVTLKLSNIDWFALQVLWAST